MKKAYRDDMIDDYMKKETNRADVNFSNRRGSEKSTGTLYKNQQVRRKASLLLHPQENLKADKFGSLNETEAGGEFRRE